MVARQIAAHQRSDEDGEAIGVGCRVLQLGVGVLVHHASGVPTRGSSDTGVPDVDHRRPAHPRQLGQPSRDEAGGRGTSTGVLRLYSW